MRRPASGSNYDISCLCAKIRNQDFVTPVRGGPRKKLNSRHNAAQRALFLIHQVVKDHQVRRRRKYGLCGGSRGHLSASKHRQDCFPLDALNRRPLSTLPFRPSLPILNKLLPLPHILIRWCREGVHRTSTFRRIICFILCSLHLLLVVRIVNVIWLQKLKLHFIFLRFCPEAAMQAMNCAVLSLSLSAGGGRMMPKFTELEDDDILALQTLYVPLPLFFSLSLSLSFSESKAGRKQNCLFGHLTWRRIYRTSIECDKLYVECDP